MRGKATQEDHLLTVAQVAARLGYDERTVLKYIREGCRGHRLPAIQFQQSYRVRESDLIAWLDQLARADAV